MAKHRSASGRVKPSALEDRRAQLVSEKTLEQISEETFEKAWGRPMKEFLGSAEQKIIEELEHGA